MDKLGNVESMEKFFENKILPYTVSGIIKQNHLQPIQKSFSRESKFLMCSQFSLIMTLV